MEREETVVNNRVALGRTLSSPLAAILLFFAPGCRERPPESRTAPAASETITIANANIVFSAPLLVAVEKGFFAAEGLEVNLKEHFFGKLALEEMLRGEADFATVADTPIVLNAFVRDDFRILATFASSYDYSKVFYRRDRVSGRPADLKGKRVGITFGTTAQFFLSLFLNFHGLREGDIQPVNLPVMQIPEALERGEIEAAVLFPPYDHRAAGLMPGRLDRFPPLEIYKETFNLVARKTVVEQRPEAVRRILRALRAATAFIEKNPIAARNIVSRKVGIGLAELESSWGSYSYNLSLEQSLLLTLEDEARWAIKGRLAGKDRMPDFLALIHRDGLRAVHPEGLGIFSGKSRP